MRRARLDEGGDGLEVEERAAAARAGDVVRLERTATGGLEDVECEPEALAGSALASDEDGVADAVGEEGTDVHRGPEQGDAGLQWFVAADVRRGIGVGRRRGLRLVTSAATLKAEAVLQQDRVLPAKLLELADEQTERGDRRKVHAVLHSHELRVAVDLVDGQRLGGIEFEDVQVLIDRLGLHVVLRTDFRRDFVEGGTGHDHADGLFAAGLDGIGQGDLGCLTAFVVEGIEGEFRILNFKF